MSNSVDKSPYCKLCGNCGVDGCCSHIACFSSLIAKSECDHKEYLQDAIFDSKIAELGHDIIIQLQNGKLDATTAVEEYGRLWDEIYNKVYTPTEPLATEARDTVAVRGG